MMTSGRKKCLKKGLVLLLTAALLVPGCGKKETEVVIESTVTEPAGKAEPQETSHGRSRAEETKPAEAPAGKEAAGEKADAAPVDDLDPGVQEAESEAPETPEPLKASAVEKLPEWQWQAKAVFPDRLGRIDDTLAMNSLLSFEGYHGQGKLYFLPSETASSFKMFVNNREVDTSEVKGGTFYELDLKDAAINGLNTLQVSGIEPLNVKEAVRVWISYPEVLAGSPEEEGITEDSLSLVSDLIESDVESGFTAAQLAVVRNGRLVYENAWGKVNSYLPGGAVDTESPEVTTDTLFDLASVTKMFATNYALQKLITDGKLSVDQHIVEFLGDRFAEDTLDFAYKGSEDLTLETQKKWKAELTIRDLLCHQGGFPSSPRYCNPYVDAVTQRNGEEYENILFAGNDASPETRAATIEAICKTPLKYEPGTKTQYSDVDYMILGLVVENITGMRLDQYVRETFYEPMGLKHITFKPSENGFAKEDVAATEVSGNTREGYLYYPGIRTETIQGEAHDEMAYYSMGGVSGHAGLFSNASDLARLASVMLTGGYGGHRFFSRNVMDLFTAPRNSKEADWGLGWWREGEDQRTWYFGETGSQTFGHQGWTGTMVMVDPVKDLVVVYLTNKINSPVTDRDTNPDKFNGGYYTASTLGFVPQLLQLPMDSGVDTEKSVFSLLSEMANDSIKLVSPAVANEADYPSVRNVESKLKVLKKYAGKADDPECTKVCEAVESRWKEYKEEAACSPEGILHEMTMEEKIEEMIMPDIRSWTGEDGNKAGVTELNPELTELLKKHKFGGVILFGDNITDADQTAKLTKALQDANREGNDKQELFIAVDQEGGRVTRLKTGTQMPGNMALGAAYDTAMAKEAARVTGSEVKALGFNMDFAPVVDVNLNPDNPVIGIRSFSDDPEMAADFGTAFSEGLHEAGVISALKHFPGHGDTYTDSHTGLPSIDKDLDTIRANELVPFDRCLKNGADMVMTAHIQYPQIEKETYVSVKDGKEIVLPATLSKAVIGGILRTDMGFDGVVITDAMNMAAVSENFAALDAASLAIGAGVDMLLMPVEMSSPEGIAAMEAYISALAEMVEQGAIEKARVDESVLRILKLKEKYGLLALPEGGFAKEAQGDAKALTGSRENHEIEWEIAKKAVTLLKNEEGLLPIKRAQGTAIVVPYETQVQSVEFALQRLEEEGLWTEGAEVSVNCIQGISENEIDGLIERVLSGNEVVIAVSSLYGNDELDPGTKDGWRGALCDRLIKEAHAADKKAVILSTQLPYDAARYPEADAILCCYNARGMTELPGDYAGDTPQYGPNIPAAIYAVFGGCDITGRLPVAIPELDGHYRYSDKILYERGEGISLSATSEEAPEETASENEASAEAEAVSENETVTEETASENEAAAEAEAVSENETVTEETASENEALAAEEETASENEASAEAETVNENETVTEETAGENEASAEAEAVSENETATEETASENEALAEEETASENEAVEGLMLGDQRFDQYMPLLEGKRVALFSNHTGIVGDETEGLGEQGWIKDPSLIPLGKNGSGKDISYGQHILDALIGHGVDVTAIFSPEHGFRGTADAGESVDSSVDEKTGVPILSLYSANTRYPSEADMERFDTLVVDMQDVGLRYYTYYISLYYLMDACAQHDKEVIILDRPNPNGFYVDGPILKEGYESGVGRLPIPVVYGMTWGELAQMINGEGWLQAGKDKLKLTVIPCLNYSHQDKIPLIRKPSPNIRDMRAVYLYASTCFFENTACSVGRGTEYPFEVFGSPLLKGAEGFDFSFTPHSIEGAAAPPFEGQTCAARDLRGVPIEDIWEAGINLDYLLDAYHAYMAAGPETDFFGSPDQKGRYWLDLLSGSDELRKQIMAGKSAKEIKDSWKEEIEAFKAQRKPYLLYEE